MPFIFCLGSLENLFSSLSTFNKACTLIRLPLFSVRFVYFRNICGFIFRLYQLPPGGQLRNLMQSLKKKRKAITSLEKWKGNLKLPNVAWYFRQSLVYACTCTLNSSWTDAKQTHSTLSSALIYHCAAWQCVFINLLRLDYLCIRIPQYINQYGITLANVKLPGRFFHAESDHIPSVLVCFQFIFRTVCCKCAYSFSI